MSVTVLDGRTPFRLTLASPAEVDGSGAVVITPANLASSAGEFTTADVSGDLTVGGTSTLTGAVSLGSTLTVASANTALRTLTVSQTADVTGLATLGTLSAGPAGQIAVNGTGIISLTLPTYADQTAAEAGGLVPPNAYVTPGGVVMVVMA